MKKLFLLFVVTCFLPVLCAKTKVIEKPEYELKSSGVTNIVRIELTDTDMRLHVHTTFIPHWWVKFPKTTFVCPSGTDQKIYAKGIENGEFDKEIYMPDSGDSTFVLIFPRLDKNVKKIDYGEEEEVEIWGVSLETSGQKKTVKTYTEQEKWIRNELGKAQKTNLTDYDSPAFFTVDTARLVGYIKGYDSRLGFSTGIIYTGNEITREDYPLVVEIAPDGCFFVDIPMLYPGQLYAVINDVVFYFYLEPGSTLAMILDWEEFLIADRIRNVRYEFKNIEFRGLTGRISAELQQTKIESLEYKTLNEYVNTLTPAEFQTVYGEFSKKAQQRLEEQLVSKDYTDQSKRILRNNFLLQSGNDYFNFLMYRRNNDKEVSKTKEESDYYDFLKLIPMDDPTLLISSDFSQFVNRFEYAPFFLSAMKDEYRIAEKTFVEYLFEELMIKPTPEDTEFLDFEKLLENIRINSQEEKDSLMKKKKHLTSEFMQRYEIYFADYQAKYESIATNSNIVKRNMKEWELKDSIQFSLGLESGFVFDVCKVRSLNHTLGILSKTDAEKYVSELKKTIQNHFLKIEADRILLKIHPEIEKIAYEIPQGKAGDLFRGIMEPYKGKFVVVDFWATSCGPCIASIKSTGKIREKYVAEGKVDFVYITSERESSKKRYDQFVAEHALTNTYRLSNDDYTYLRQLFQFNGIPRYILLDKEGRVLDGNFSMHSFEYKIGEILNNK